MQGESNKGVSSNGNPIERTRRPKVGWTHGWIYMVVSPLCIVKHYYITWDDHVQCIVLNFTVSRLTPIKEVILNCLSYTIISLDCGIGEGKCINWMQIHLGRTSLQCFVGLFWLVRYLIFFAQSIWTQLIWALFFLICAYLWGISQWKGKCTKRPMSSFGCTIFAFFGFWVFSLWYPLGNYEKKSCLKELKLCEVSENPKSSICWKFQKNRLKIEKSVAKWAHRPFCVFPLLKGSIHVR